MEEPLEDQERENTETRQKLHPWPCYRSRWKTAGEDQRISDLSLLSWKRQNCGKFMNLVPLRCFSDRMKAVRRTKLIDWFSKDNATVNRTARAQENNRLGLGRELGRVAIKSDLAKNNRTWGMWKHMFSKFICSLVLWGISRLFFAFLKSDWEHKHAWLMN